MCVCVSVCRLVENLHQINTLQTADWETVVFAPRATPSAPEHIIDLVTFVFLFVFLPSEEKFQFQLNFFLFTCTKHARPIGSAVA